MMNFVKEKMSSAVFPVPIRKIGNIMRGKPYVVKGNEKRFPIIFREGFMNVLQNKRCFAGSFRTSYAYKSAVPIDLRIQMPL